LKTLAAAVGLASLAGCATMGDGMRCDAGSTPASTAELYFGRNISETAGVSDAEWQAFVDEEITPRFPDGLTVIDAAGRWRGADGALGREASKVVVIVLSGKTDERSRLDAVREAYKDRFRQEAVLLVEHRACVAF
jgi:broad specificity phosphatase PhoE